MPSSVYLIRIEGTDAVKIGSSEYPTHRLRTLHVRNTLMPPEYSKDSILKLLYTQVFIEPRESLIIEKRLQHRFTKHKIKGEWYRLDQQRLDQAIAFLQSPHTIPELHPRETKTEAEKFAQQEEMFQLGVSAVENAVCKTEWPKVGERYSAEYYRCKAAWLAGYESTGESLFLVSPRILTGETIEQRISRKITERAPIPRWELIRLFPTQIRPDVRQFVDKWISEGSLITSGSGRRGSPIYIEGINME